LHRARIAMEEKSLFISSCSRRDLARRRPHRLLPPLPVAVIVLAMALAAVGIVMAVSRPF
jgi:hypothetical protein